MFAGLGATPGASVVGSPAATWAFRYVVIPGRVDVGVIENAHLLQKRYLPENGRKGRVSKSRYLVSASGWPTCSLALIDYQMLRFLSSTRFSGNVNRRGRAD